MIAKKVHYIWLGGKQKNKLAQICLLTWKNVMPDYDIIEWNENNLDLDKIAQENQFFAECRKRNLYAFMADYLRIKILYEHGGIYIDTDVQAIKPLDDLLHRDILLGYEEYTLEKHLEQIGTGLMGAEKENWFIKKIFDFYNNEIMNTDLFIVPDIMTRKYNELTKEEKSKIEILPKEYFAPLDSGGCKHFSDDIIGENTYTIHWFANSWVNFKSKKWIQVKHIKNPLKRIIKTVQNRQEFYKVMKEKKKMMKKYN